jgi:hypothetical protein
MNEYTFITDGLVHFILYAVLGISVFMMAMFGTYIKFRWKVQLMAVFFAIFMGVSYISLGELLGRPKPVEILFWGTPDVEEARVLGQFFKKDVGIYLLLIYPGQSIPRYFQFPWNEDMAEQLKRAEAARQMEENQGVKIKYPFQPTHEEREFPEVYEIPWPAPPQKHEQRIRQIDLDAIDA